MGKLRSKKNRRPVDVTPEKTIGEIFSDISSAKRRTRQSDSTSPSSLPLRMFARGQEPFKKKVNSYFSLNYFEVVKKGLDEDQIQTLMDSQFGTLLGIGNKVAFSVKFAHFLLCRQLITKKCHEIWVLFGGQPIRFSLREFSLVTSLNCSVISEEHEIAVTDHTRDFAKELFGQDVPPTPKWIVEKLSGAPYKDRETRMRLALLLIVDGVLCRKSGEAKISLESVEVVRDIHRFLTYPWGRKSFDITMTSIGTSLIHKYTQSSAAIQGFIHALQMVVLACSPNILTTDPGAYSSLGSDDEENPSLLGIGTKPINIYMPLVRKLDHDDKARQGDVISILPARADQRRVEKQVKMSDMEDPSVEYMMSLIRSKHKFTHQSWKGGVRAADVVKHKKVEEVESNQLDVQKIMGEVGDACFERVQAVNQEFFAKMQDMFELAITSIQTDVLLKFCKLENMFYEIQNPHNPSAPRSPLPQTSPRHVPHPVPQDSDGSESTPDVNQSRSVPDRASDEDMNSPDRSVRNVLADLEAAAEDDSGSGVKSHSRDDGSLKGSDSEEADSNPSCHNVAENSDLGVEHILQNKEFQDQPDTMIGHEEGDPNIETQPQPLAQCGKDEYMSTLSNQVYDEFENPVIMLGWSEEVEVPPGDENILPTVVDGPGEAVLGELTKDDVVPPSFSLGLTQELKKRKLFSKVYLRKNKRTKFASSSYTDYVVELPNKGSHCSVTEIFKPPAQAEVELITKAMDKPSYFPTYNGHTLVEANFLELLRPAAVTSTLVMDTLISYLHDSVLQQSNAKDPPKYDFLDYTFLNDIGLLHVLIEPNKRRKKLPINNDLTAYVKSRRNLYTEVDTLLCPFLLEDKHWVGVVVKLAEHKIIVLDCNEDDVEFPIVDALLTPFASALPYVTRQLAYNSEMKHDDLSPFQITRPTLNINLPGPELSGIASVMLMLIHAKDKLDKKMKLTRKQVEDVMKHYAVSLFQAVMKNHPGQA